MFCGQCGTKIDGEDRFCNNCGTESFTINNWDELFKTVKNFSKQKHEQKILAKEEKEKQAKKELAKEKRQDKKRLAKEKEEKQEKERKEKEEKEKQGRIEQGTVAELIRTLSPKDYIVLESLRREDLQLSLKLGTMELMAIMEKLFRCGLIKRLDREPTFDEKEKILKFMDSPAYKQHEKRVKKLSHA